MAISFPPLHDAQFFDNSGLPLSEGYYEALIAGTSTHTEIYNYNNEEQSNPVQLNPSGRVQLKLDDTIVYDIKLYNKDMSLIRTIPSMSFPSGNGSPAVTMDTIAQGSDYKKVPVNIYNNLTDGGVTILHSHTWESVTGKPATFTPTNHALNHSAAGGDPLAHNYTNPSTTSATEVYGHVSNGSQVIYGNKSFNDDVSIGDGVGTGQLAIVGNRDSALNAQADSGAIGFVLSGTHTDTTLTRMQILVSPDNKVSSIFQQSGVRSSTLTNEKLSLRNGLTIETTIEPDKTITPTSNAGDFKTLDDKSIINTWNDWRWAGTGENPPGAEVAAVLTQVSTGEWLWVFPTQAIMVFPDQQIPHSYKEGTEIVPHIHFTSTTSALYTGTWTAIITLWESVASGTVKTTVTRTASFNKILTAGQMESIDFSANIGGANTKISACATIQLKLVLTAGTSLALLGFDGHFQQDRLGSSTISTK